MFVYGFPREPPHPSDADSISAQHRCASSNGRQMAAKTRIDVQVKSADVARVCRALSWQVDAETQRQGRMMGARQLLSRIVRGRPGWFSEFLKILLVTEHKALHDELTGCPLADKGTGRSLGSRTRPSEVARSPSWPNQRPHELLRQHSLSCETTPS